MASASSPCPPLALPPFSATRLPRLLSWPCTAYVRLPFQFLPFSVSPFSPTPVSLPRAPFFCYAPRFSALPRFLLSVAPRFLRFAPPFPLPVRTFFSSDPTPFFFRTRHPLRLCLPSSGPGTEDGKGVGAVSQIRLRTGGGEASIAIHFSGCQFV